jgi:hypothetical protein
VSIETCRSNANRKREEISRLSEQKAREQKRIADLNGKIQSATRSIKTTKSLSLIQSRQNEILRYQNDIAKVEKNIADYEHKIAHKNKELQIELKHLSDEETRESKRQRARDKDYQDQQARVFNGITKTLNEHDKAIEKLSILPKEITVLFMASNPEDQVQLQLDEEVRSIHEMIIKAKHRDSVKLQSCWAVRPMDILQAINEYEPTIVHFSGHGSDKDELVLMDNSRNTKLVPIEAITQAMKVANDNLRIVFFNTCFSYNQAKSIVMHVDAAIGMNKSISDDAARVFSAQFYSSISFGLSVEKSFNQAKAALMLAGIKEENTPELFVKEGIDANALFIVGTEVS